MLRFLLLLSVALTCWCAPRAVIVDTDAGVDDLLAIAFLLSRPDVRIEAVTVVHGLAHVPDGSRNVLRLLEAGARKDVPVYAGREKPLKETAEFPVAWRETSDKLPGVTLPEPSRQVESRGAVEFLRERLCNGRPRAHVLALGPLTNLAEVLAGNPRCGRGVASLTVMGGAVRVAGNLGDGGYFKTDNKTAEWNLFADPKAAAIVFAAGIPMLLVPLDATNKVPIDAAFLTRFQSEARTALGRAAASTLGSVWNHIEQNFYYAWDPLAAVALVDPSVVKTRRLAIEVRQDAPEQGRTLDVAGARPNARVAMDADAASFKRTFLGAFTVR